MNKRNISDNLLDWCRSMMDDSGHWKDDDWTGWDELHSSLMQYVEGKHKNIMTNKERERLIKEFKPQFGNTNHTRALEIINKIKVRDAVKKKKGEIEQELFELDNDLELETKNLEFLIKSKI